MTALEIITQYKRLSEDIAHLENLRDLLPKAASDWERFGFDAQCRNGTAQYMAMVFRDASGRWKWRAGKTRWRNAKPNTEAGAKACAEAQLLADGVLLA